MLSFSSRCTSPTEISWKLARERDHLEYGGLSWKVKMFFHRALYGESERVSRQKYGTLTGCLETVSFVPWQAPNLTRRACSVSSSTRQQRARISKSWRNFSIQWMSRKLAAFHSVLDAKTIFGPGIMRRRVCFQ